MDYVVGLMHDGTRMVFVKKNKPEWQAGKLNGPGGKIEDGETPAQTMTREFAEETGVRYYHWNHFLTLSFDGGRVFFFRAAVLPQTVDRTRAMEDEVIIKYPLRYFGSPTGPEFIPNLSWIVPLALYNHDYYKVIEVEEA